MYLSTKDREQGLRLALVKGFKKHGVTVLERFRSDFWNNTSDKEIDSADVVAFVGVKSRKMWNVCVAKNKTTLILDKSYFERGGYYRMALGGYQPDISSMSYGPQRLQGLGISIKQRQWGGSEIIYAGSSNKYHMFHGLPEVGDYASDVCRQLRETVKGKFQIVYRPKPSWWINADPKQKILPSGVRFSSGDEHFSTVLRRAWCVVTHGSNAAVEALAAGVPVIMLSEEGISPVWSLCNHDLEDVHYLSWPNDAARLGALSNLAWCQFSTKEIESGMAWGCVSKQIKEEVS